MGSTLIIHFLSRSKPWNEYTKNLSGVYSKRHPKFFLGITNFYYKDNMKNLHSRTESNL